MMIDVPRLLKALGIDAEKRGRELWARCPYPGHTSDATPSWSIADGGDRNGANYCFGCGRSGGALDLIIGIVGLSGYSAAHTWIEEHGLGDSEYFGSEIKLCISDRVRDQRRSSLLIPPAILFAPLNRWPRPARVYALKRGLTDTQIRRWNIGYSVDGSLAGRIWIPTRDAAGSLLDWTARSWSREEPRYKCPRGGGARGAIFGEQYWPPIEIRAQSMLVVCEGAFDALACERAGAKCLAAFGGVSKYDRWSAMKIAGWGEILIAVDPDAAGDHVADLLELLSRDSNVRRITLPAGVDCDALWNQDPNALRNAIKIAD